MWRNHYLTVGPLRVALCLKPSHLPWALFAVWRWGDRQWVLIDWEGRERPHGD